MTDIMFSGIAIIITSCLFAIAILMHSYATGKQIEFKLRPADRDANKGRAKVHKCRMGLD